MTQQLGPLQIQTAGSQPARTLQRDDGLWLIQIPGAATLTNTAGQRLILSVSAGAQEGAHTVATFTETVTLAPGQVWSLPAPPAGGPWVLLSVPRRTAVAWGWWAGLGIGVTLAFGLYGGYAAQRDARHAWRRWRERRRARAR